MQNDECQRARAEIMFRRRALQANCGIHACCNGPSLLPVLSGVRIQAQYLAQMAWLGSEAVWSDADASRISALAAEIARFGQSRELKTAETCDWHAARLCELVGQYAALRRLEAGRSSLTPWWALPAESPAPRRKAGGVGGLR